MQRRMQMRERTREGTRAESLRRTSPFPLMMAAAAGEREGGERKGEPLVARDTIYGNRPTASFKQIKVKGSKET